MVLHFHAVQCGRLNGHEARIHAGCVFGPPRPDPPLARWISIDIGRRGHDSRWCIVYIHSCCYAMRSKPFDFHQKFGAHQAFLSLTSENPPGWRISLILQPRLALGVPPPKFSIVRKRITLSTTRIGSISALVLFLPCQRRTDWANWCSCLQALLYGRRRRDLIMPARRRKSLILVTNYLKTGVKDSVFKRGRDSRQRWCVAWIWVPHHRLEPWPLSLPLRLYHPMPFVLH